MNDVQRQQIHTLRNAGYSYGKIATKLNINENTIKTYCKGGIAKKTPLTDSPFQQCLNCGISIQQNPR